MANERDYLVWIDCEMTGLDLSLDELIEIAVVITDYDLNIVDPGLQLVIKPSDAALAQMNDFVTNMHQVSGLINDLPDGLSLQDAQAEVLAYLQRFVPQGKAPMAGNTIGTDRAFIERYMPEVNGWLHYRNVDVSSIKELSKRWFHRAYQQAPQKKGGHRALADILESIQELHYYRRAVFLAEPGYTSDELKEISAEAVSSFSAKV